MYGSSTITIPSCLLRLNEKQSKRSLKTLRINVTFRRFFFKPTQVEKPKLRNEKLWDTLYFYDLRAIYPLLKISYMSIFAKIEFFCQSPIIAKNPLFVLQAFENHQNTCVGLKKKRRFVKRPRSSQENRALLQGCWLFEAHISRLT